MMIYACLDLLGEDIESYYGLHEDAEKLIDGHAMLNADDGADPYELGEDGCIHGIALLCIDDGDYIAWKLTDELEGNLQVECDE